MQGVGEGKFTPSLIIAIWETLHSLLVKYDSQYSEAAAERSSGKNVFLEIPVL